MKKTNTGFIPFAQKLVAHLESIGRISTAESYATSINSFIRFCNGRKPLLVDIDVDLISSYESFLRTKGLCPNTTSFYMRNLRAIYNRAVEKGFAEPNNPFRHVYTGIDKTVKRAVPLSVVRRLRDLDLSNNPSLDLARDLFMFSFYTRGMSFVDMAYLRKVDLCDGILTYRRRKTGQQLFVRWEAPMQLLIEKYDTSATPFLLPIIRCPNKNEREQYKNEIHRTNRNLRDIGNMLGFTKPLTTYVARHSWASIARSHGVPLTIICEAMGHESEETTRIYLDCLDTTQVDNANEMIINSI